MPNWKLKIPVQERLIWKKVIRTVCIKYALAKKIILENEIHFEANIISILHVYLIFVMFMISFS